MTPKETVCLSCGASILPAVDKSSFKYRFVFVVKIFFVISAVMTAVALFTPWGPPFVTCISVTLVLALVKNSADEMLVNQSEK